jgi:RNA polymerase sigma-70 factor, ECF subfamily
MGFAGATTARPPAWRRPPTIVWPMGAQVAVLRARLFAVVSRVSNDDADEPTPRSVHREDVQPKTPADAVAQRLFETLYAEHRSKVAAYCLRLTGNREVAEDLAQEAFLYAWAHRDVLPSHPAPAQWLFRVASHQSLDHLRRQRRWERLSRLALPLLGRQHDAIDRQVEARDALDWAIRRLPPALRQTWVLREVQGFTYHEVAAILSQQEETISKRLYRAREALKRLLRERGDAPEEAPGEDA